MTGMLWQFARFGLVGGAATALHFVAALMLIEAGVSPLLANGGAFALAFGVSFVGHRSFTFHAGHIAVIPALSRFAVTALAGFAVNQAMFAGLLLWSVLPVSLSLAAALCVAAAVTFVASRVWAFKLSSLKIRSRI